jgi:periplasmic protein TonB
MYEVNDSLEQKLPVILRQSVFSYQESLEAYWHQEWEDLANLSVAELNFLNADEDSRQLPVHFAHDTQTSAQSAPLPWSKWERAVAAGLVGSVLLHAGILTLQLPAPKVAKVEEHGSLIMARLAPQKVAKIPTPKRPDPTPPKPTKTAVAQKAPEKSYSARPMMSTQFDAAAGPVITSNMLPGSQGTGAGTDKGTGDGTNPEGVPNGGTDDGTAKVASAPPPLPPPQPPLTTVKPQLRSEIIPDYPEIAKQNNWEGRVVVLAHISETGTVESAEIARSSGHSELDEAALAAVKASRFEPAHRGDAAIAGTVRVPITFSLQ